MKSITKVVCQISLKDHTMIRLKNTTTIQCRSNKGNEDKSRKKKK